MVCTEKMSSNTLVAVSRRAKDPMLDGEDRDDKIKKLLKQRDPVYQKFADIQVTTGEVPFEEYK